MLNNKNRDHISDIIPGPKDLHSNTDKFSVLNNRPAAVSGIDRRIDLDRQQMTGTLHIRSYLNTGDYSFGYGYLTSTLRISNNRNAILLFGKVPQFQWSDPFKKIRVIDFKKSKVTVMPDSHYFSRIFFGISIFFDLNEGMVSDNMRIGKNTVTLDDRAGTAAGSNAFGLPGPVIIHSIGCHKHLHNGIG